MCIRQFLYLEGPLADETLNQLTYKKYGAQSIQPGDVLPAYTVAAKLGWVKYAERKMYAHLIGNNIINMYQKVYIMPHQKPTKNIGSPQELACVVFSMKIKRSLFFQAKGSPPTAQATEIEAAFRTPLEVY